MWKRFKNFSGMDAFGCTLEIRNKFRQNKIVSLGLHQEKKVYILIDMPNKGAVVLPQTPSSKATTIGNCFAKTKGPVMKHLALLFTFFLFVSCNLKNEAVDANKQEQEQEIIPANAISPQTADPAKILLKAKLSLPANLKEKPLPSDLVIWSLINSEGAVVAGAVEQLPAFPWQFQVQVKNLMQPISPETRLLLSIRIVHNGEETMPPQKGQLEVMLGSTSSEPEPAVGKAGISSKILAKIEKKLKEQIDASRDLSIGDSVEGNFQPSENSF